MRQSSQICILDRIPSCSRGPAAHGRAAAAGRNTNTSGHAHALWELGHVGVLKGQYVVTSPEKVDLLHHIAGDRRLNACVLIIVRTNLSQRNADPGTYIACICSPVPLICIIDNV